jgi:hypothetical protein
MNDELNDEERAALAAYEAPVPPDGFAARVLEARATPAPAAAPAPRRTGWIVGGVVAAALVAAAAVVVVTRDEAPAPVAGAHVAEARVELALGRRGVAVAEVGAALSWQVASDGAARVEQSTGNVFYRVEPGGSFVVTTPAGDVRVTGTCFRVEVQMSPSSKKPALAGAAIGAALAAGVVVTVYEGGVIAAGRDGREHRASAGEQIALDGADALAANAPTPLPPPPDSATREELLARDVEQRATIDRLAVQVAKLEREAALAKAAGATVSAGRGGPDDDGDGRPWFDPSPELLAEWVKDCRVRMDLPPVFESAPFSIGPEEAAELGVATEEIDGVNTALRELHDAWHARVRALYIEATGDAEGADRLSPTAMGEEIEDKAAPGEAQQIRGKLARERAGLEPVPTNLAGTTPLERYFRGLAALGEETEQALAKHIGADRAHALRAKNDGWGHKSEYAGCPDANPR